MSRAAPAFEAVVFGTPVSQQARRRARVREWMAEVARAAAAVWPNGEPTWPGPVALELTHFHDGRAIDLDNLPKPVLDAIKGFVLRDDRQVERLVVQRYRLGAAAPAARTTPRLEGALRARVELVHILIARWPAAAGEDDH